MPSVTCPTCGERGKIPPTLIGSRIKCKKCGNSFVVSPPAAKAPVAAASASSPVADESHGIEVEGLDASSWSLSTEAGPAHKGEATATVEPDQRPDASAFTAAGPSVGGAREYKLLTPKDKYFDGKFELARLEDALNHFARQGWIVKAVSTPHVKNFSGVLEEAVVVLLER
jgi:hypothetical protein